MSVATSTSRHLGRVLVLSSALLLWSVPAIAGDASDPPTAESRQKELDLHDLWLLARHKPLESEATQEEAAKPLFVLAPSITSKPSTGFTVGIAATRAFVFGGEETTHLSSVAANFKVSVKGQTTSSVRYGMFLPHDQWFLQGDTRFQWTSLDTYGLGTTSSPAAQNLKYDWFRVYQTPYRRVWQRLFIGGGLNVDNHRSIRPGEAPATSDEQAYLSYTLKHGFPLSGQTSSGVNLGFLVDTRDNAVSADRGWLANATYRAFFQEFLGGDATWQELNLDVRTYRRLTRDARQKLAFWFLGSLVTGGTAPYFDLPSTASDTYGRSGRGYSDGRFRGPHMLYGEIEYRGTLTRNGLLGMVAFLNTTTVDGDEEDSPALFQSFATGAGVGARVRFDKHTRTNICVDYGWGKQGSRGLYVAIQETF